MSGRTVLCYHPRYDGRGFSPVQRSWGRYRTAWDLFARLGLLGGAGAPVRHVCQRPAAPEQLLPVHPPEYVEYIRRRDAEGSGSLDGRETPAWRGVFERALIAVGGSLEGADLIGSGAATHVFNPGGGLHHARRAATAGFCIFNDVALAVHRLRADYGLARVAVVDVDGHHGDGTQELLYDQPVLTISLHQYDGRFFPGTGSVDEVGWGHGFGYSVNAGLPRHTGDDGYLAAFGAIVPAALRRYRPQAILLNFGVDGHFADPLVRLWLSTASYRAVAGAVHALAHELCAGRLLVFGSGGYHPLHAARCWGTMVATLADALPAAQGRWPARFADLQDERGPLPGPGTRAAVEDTIARVCDGVLPLVR
ncbi:MAG TPA: acetoin utilization protein AcuC [Chloroflexota bacterium]|nr:acetoin utilization protein AcuC [Chloroflexota bacterium]